MTRPDVMLLQLWFMLTDRPKREDGERGDVPGWVMVTVMSAALIVAIIAIAEPALKNLFTDSTTKVSGAK